MSTQEDFNKEIKQLDDQREDFNKKINESERYEKTSRKNRVISFFQWAGLGCIILGMIYYNSTILLQANNSATPISILILEIIFIFVYGKIVHLHEIATLITSILNAMSKK